MTSANRNPTAPIHSTERGPANWIRSFSVDFCCVFCVFFLYAGSQVPAINEPHYWTKAAHFWNASFGQGDLFLESGDAHYLFFATFGMLTQWMPIAWAVWLGRFVTWIFLAVGWTMLGRSLWFDPCVCDAPSDSGKANDSSPLLAGCWGLVWLAGLHFGHWAGEWVIGGCESKGIAYAMIFAGLALAIRERWTVAWALLGGAAAFHVVTGIWVILSVVTVSWFVDMVWARAESGPRRTAMQWVALHRAGWALCAIGVVIGVVPAMAIDWGTDPMLASQSAVKQVYTRLGHHLAPTRFNWIRWRDFGVQLGCGAIAFCWLARATGVGKVGGKAIPRGLKMVIGWGLFGFAIAVFGLMIDLAFGRSFPQYTSKLLRFYLFRWNDVAFPMMVGAIMVSFAFGRLGFPANGATKRGIGTTIRWVAWAYTLVPGLILLAYRFEANYNEQIPAGDKAHFVAKSDSDADQVKQYKDWLKVCDWISKNSEQDSLWLTPRRQQSFKWHTGRPELASWKDAPQNAAALVDWSQRLADAYLFDKEKILQPWTTEKLWELHNKYGIRYVLLDRRVAKQTPPLLPILYPTQNELNDTFAVFEIPSQKVNVSK
jgi:hypothetical protein